ncbi:MAG TPA: hypothetical protein GXX29_05015 [Firmicutes bacterium]|nr:hypothetical protein [Bacillota bacterium]
MAGRIHSRINDEIVELDAFRIDLPAPTAAKSVLEMAGLDFHDRQRLFYPGIVYSADTFIDSLGRRVDRVSTHKSAPNMSADNILANHVGELADEDFLYCERRAPVQQKIRQLHQKSEFSHCRAAAIAAGALADNRLAYDLYNVLMLPGMSGHAQLDTLTVVTSANSVQTYANDLRGQFARHAQAVLLHPDPKALGKIAM